MASIEIEGRRLGNGDRPYVIAEVGTNFGADLALGKRFVKVAAESGADAVKFQTLNPECDMAKEEMKRIGMGDVYENVSENSLNIDEHRELKEHCDENGITFLSTPFSAESVEILEEVGTPAIKIGSGELTDFHILKTAAETGKPILLSTGMADKETVSRSCDFLREHGADFALLYCVSLYPTDPEQFDFGVINDFRETFGVPVGFSDHSRGTGMAAVAMSRGASIVEKHFTLSRHLPGGDQSVSAEPDELSEIVEFARLCHETRGSEKLVYEEEKEVAEWARHSIITVTEIGAGEELTEENLTTKRPGTGIPASRFYDVVGRSADEAIKEDEVVREEHLR